MLFQEVVVVRPNASDHQSMDASSFTAAASSNRIVWLVSIAPRPRASTDLFISGLSSQKIAYDLFGADASIFDDLYSYSLATDSTGDDDGDEQTRKHSSTGRYWQQVLEHSAQLIMTSLLHSFEMRQMVLDQQRSAAMVHFDRVFRAGSDKVGSVGIIDPTAIWQQLSSEMERYLNDNVLGSMVAYNDELDIEQERVATCHCEIFVTAAQAVNTTKRSSNVIPTITSGRVVHNLYLNEESQSLTNDGYSSALNKVLVSCLWSDDVAVHSYSQVSFQDKQRGQAIQDQQPLVEFHTLLAYPVQAAAATASMHDKPGRKATTSICVPIKACIVVHIVCSENYTVDPSPSMRALSKTSSMRGDDVSAYIRDRSHPVYADPLVLDAADSDPPRAFVDRYYLLEANRRPMVEEIATVLQVVGGLAMEFLVRSHYRSISLFANAGGGVPAHILSAADMSPSDSDSMSEGLYSIINSSEEASPSTGPTGSHPRVPLLLATIDRAIGL